MKALLAFCWNFLCLRAGPQHFSSSRRLLGLLSVLTLLLNTCVIVFRDKPLLSALSWASIALVSVLTLFWLLLYVRQVSHRYVQTVNAVLTLELLLQMLSVGVWATVAFLLSIVAVSIVPLVLMTLLFTWLVFAKIWMLVVTGYIIHEALAVPIVVGLILAFALLLIRMLILMTVIQ